MSKALALVCFMPPYYIASMENRLLRSNGLEPLWFAGRVACWVWDDAVWDAVSARLLERASDRRVSTS